MFKHFVVFATLITILNICSLSLATENKAIKNSPACIVHNPNPDLIEKIEWSGRCSKEGKASGFGVAKYWRDDTLMISATEGYFEDGIFVVGKHTPRSGKEQYCFGKNCVTDFGGYYIPSYGGVDSSKKEGEELYTRIIKEMESKRNDDPEFIRKHLAEVITRQPVEARVLQLIKSDLVACDVADSDIKGIYWGSCKDGLADGFGIAGKKDLYIGDFKAGKRFGKGLYVWETGDRYEGYFVDDARMGKGVFVWKNNDKYEGDFENDKRTGNGVLVLNNGDRYEGLFVDGKKTGKGRMLYKNGDYCDGTFINDEFSSGHGRMSANSISGPFEGEYLNGTIQNGFSKGAWFKGGASVTSCSSYDGCKIKVKLEPLINKAASSYRCEEAKKLNGQLNPSDSIFNFESCVDDRSYYNAINNKDPQKMYIAAGKYESNGERSRAKKIYLSIMDRFPKHALAIKSTDRLTALRDVEAVEDSNRNAAEAVKRSNERAVERAEAASRNAADAASRASSDARDLSKKACQDRQFACWRGCEQSRDSWSCKQGCPSCSY